MFCRPNHHVREASNTRLVFQISHSHRQKSRVEPRNPTRRESHDSLRYTPKLEHFTRFQKLHNLLLATASAHPASSAPPPPTHTPSRTTSSASGSTPPTSPPPIFATSSACAAKTPLLSPPPFTPTPTPTPTSLSLSASSSTPLSRFSRGSVYDEAVDAL